MDFLQNLLPMDLLQDYLPQAARFYNNYYYPYRTYLAPIWRTLYLTQSYFYRYIFPTLYPLYALCNNALQSLSSDTPDILTLVGLAVVLLISFKALDYMRKTIIAWIALAIRLGMWLVVGFVGVYVWQRGVEQSVEDFGWVWGLLAGLGEEGERIGGRKAQGRERDARRMRGPGAGPGKRRTRGAW
ncbi:hypothetical protein N7G274_003837 [Stereocaulon virgatum]|uniref:Uncharacterized protein n=1 Tax=Stereocaulon virgatum TaxID=373712 RepID=A0ABR4AEI9_9LECA